MFSELFHAARVQSQNDAVSMWTKLNVAEFLLPSATVTSWVTGSDKLTIRRAQRAWEDGGVTKLI